MSETVHLAGMQVEIGGRYLRQLCSWCGAQLIHYDLAMTAFAVEEGQEPAKPATWEPGAVVLVDGPLSTVVDHADGERLPATSCVTRELDAYECTIMEQGMNG